MTFIFKNFMTRFALLLIAAVLFAFPVAGQTAPPNDETDKTGEEQTELPEIREEVTVTAARDELETDKSPVSTSVVTQQESRIRSVQTVDQSLNLTPGVLVLRTKGNSDNLTRVQIRGFNGQERTLVLLDGQPINDGYSGGVSWTSLPLNEVDRVEVVRGPFSSLYGGNALGGVINVLTRPIDRRSIELAGQYGTYDTTNYSARYSDLFFERLGVAFGYRRLQTGGYNTRFITASTTTTGTTGTRVSGVIPTETTQGAPLYIIGRAGDNWYNSHAYRAKVEYKFTENTNASVQYIRQNSGYGYDAYTSFLTDAAGNAVDRGPILFSDNGVTRRLNFTPGNFLQGSGDNSSNFLNGSFVHTFSPDLFVRASFGTFFEPESTSGTPTAASATLSGGPGTISIQNSRNYYANGQLNYQVFKKHDLVFGTETRYERSRNQNYNLANYAGADSRLAQTFESLGKTFNQAFYAQDQFRARDNLTIIGGLRYDYWRTDDSFSNGFSTFLPLTEFGENSTKSLTYKIAVAWQPINDWTVRASIGTAFRNPNVLELYRSFRLATGTLFLANPALQPEKLFSYEFGLRKRFGARTELEATYYRNQITDLIYRKTDLAADPTGRTRVLVNAGEGRTNGVELAARQQIFSWLQLRASYTYTDAIISRNPALPETEGKRVPNIPKHAATASFLGSWKKFYGSGSARYVTESFALDTNADRTKNVLGSYDLYFLLDASLGYRVNSKLDVFVSAENLTNRQYYLFYLNPGRTANVGARFHW